MARDYAKRQKRGQTPIPSMGLPAWVWFSTGAATGLIVALLIYIGFAPDIPTGNPVQDNPVPDVEVSEADDKPGDQGDEIEWEFYEIFPRAQVPVTEVDQPDTKPQVSVADAVYMLQIGSFRDPGDADSLRAKLILKGFEATLYEAEKDGETWHRVMVGPVQGDLALSRTRTRLAEHDHPALTLRIR